MAKTNRLFKKQSNSNVSMALLNARYHAAKNNGYEQKAKWIEFCEALLSQGFKLKLYEAQRTFSKYITVSHSGSSAKPYKVRFSNHKPIKHREKSGDCDFFVGRTHLATTTTEQAIKAVLEHFGELKVAKPKQKPKTADSTQEPPWED